MQEETAWVPWQRVFVGSWTAIQFQEVNVSQLEQALVSAQVALEEEAQEHTDECSWWQDWHACNCGANDKSE